MEAGEFTQRAKNHPWWTAFLVIVGLLVIYGILFVFLGYGSEDSGAGNRIVPTMTNK